ncbi:hypothetical protein CYMTET_39081 [Cymbomonas tetramitiformis]|uniref:Uncharacterized protein n=1 Tax=Cymbomonas tetramitiformis TaxID=36881 RepID=A0AAE0CAS6_9CHLO|nr:hypothetical protein CYMTET_39081 [Cymbomonas tetramitiformis]
MRDMPLGTPTAEVATETVEGTDEGSFGLLPPEGCHGARMLNFSQLEGLQPRKSYTCASISSKDLRLLEQDPGSQPFLFLVNDHATRQGRRLALRGAVLSRDLGLSGKYSAL